jgi:hypothetical protein
MKYLVRGRPDLTVQRNDSSARVPAELFVRACYEFNVLVDKFDGFGVDVFRLLGMRNLSSFLGELYGSVVIRDSKCLYRKNPHQDGYPDLLLMDEIGSSMWSALEGRFREKAPERVPKTGPGGVLVFGLG